ncbi:MAG: threonine/serine dehydratase [Rhodospirillaceae bacterium]|nr:threonine/serine dehydratase [Rhodospirillaceae bacterium]
MTSPLGPELLPTLAAARARIAPYIHRTPLWHSALLSRLTGCDVYLKCELFQKTGSFKPRGMLNKLLTLTPEQKERGAITFSAGNAAQGLAYAGGIVGVKAVVVMPETASPIKAQATRDYGGEVVQKGDSAQCYAHSLELVKERGYTFVSSFDDRTLMEGHASLGLEILEDVPDADTVLVPIGGGGLIGGIILGLRAAGSKAEIVGVEPTGAPAMYRSLEAGKPVRLDRVSTIADGLAAPYAGEACFPLVRDGASGVVLLEDEEIAEAIRLLLFRCKVLAEGAGASSVAALLTGKVKPKPGAKVVCVVSGGNIDPARLKSLL